MNYSKRAIIDAAFELFQELGYEETTVKKISEKADVAYGTVYFHFPSGKDGVLNEISKLITGEFYQIIDQELVLENVEDVYRTTYDQLLQCLKIVEENKRIMQVIWEAKGKSEVVYQNLLTLEKKFIHRVAKYIIENRKKGIGKPTNPMLASKALMHMAWGFIWDYTFDDTLSAEDIAKTVVDIYMYGIY